MCVAVCVEACAAVRVVVYVAACAAVRVAVPVAVFVATFDLRNTTREI